MPLAKSGQAKRFCENAESADSLEFINLSCMEMKTLPHKELVILPSALMPDQFIKNLHVSQCYDGSLMALQMANRESAVMLCRLLSARAFHQ